MDPTFETNPNSGSLNWPGQVPKETIFPAIGEAADNASLEQERDAIRSSKIMIIDDEDLVIRVVRRFLSSDGYENFVTLTDPREALQAINREQPDVVLLDIRMPNGDGKIQSGVVCRWNLESKTPVEKTTRVHPGARSIR